MKKMIKLSALCATLLAAIAATNVAQAQNNLFTGPQEVVSILTNANGSLFVILGDMSTSPSCATTTSSYFLNANGAAGARGMYAMILTAQVSGQRVTLSLDNNNCTSTGFAEITSARIVQ